MQSFLWFQFGTPQKLQVSPYNSPNHLVTRGISFVFSTQKITIPKPTNTQWNHLVNCFIPFSIHRKTCFERENKMVAKKFAETLLITALVVLAMATHTEALSDCAKNCMPTCLKVDGASMSQCEQACEQYCMTQGAPPIHIFPGPTSKWAA